MNIKRSKLFIAAIFTLNLYNSAAVHITIDFIIKTMILRMINNELYTYMFMMYTRELVEKLKYVEKWTIKQICAYRVSVIQYYNYYSAF